MAKIQIMLWGIDLGGTKIEGVVIDETPDQTLCRMRVPSLSADGYEQVLGQICHLVAAMEQEVGPRPKRIGIGTPGATDQKSGGLRNSNSTCLIGRPLKTDLEQMLGVHIRIENDANCFALAEANFGSAKDGKVVFGVIMGTGVGGGIVVNGSVLDGAQGIAGEWGHNVLEPDGDDCYCGKRGCVETVVSGPALERYYQRSSGHRADLHEIVKAAREGSDEDAKATLNRLTESFGKALSVVVNILDPDIIVLGGGVGNIDELYTEGVEALRHYVFNNELLTLVRRPALGDSAGVFGAAQLTSTRAEGQS
jgi:predicted NBD/HSP70 family sugar kinase